MPPKPRAPNIPECVSASEAATMFKNAQKAIGEIFARGRGEYMPSPPNTSITSTETPQPETNEQTQKP